MAKKMQPYKFRSINEFLYSLEEEELKIVQILREIILENIPNCTEKLSYNVPFYSKSKTICFIWPGSVLWGSKQTYQGVRLGFYQGHLLSDSHGILKRGDRKQVFWIDFSSTKDIPVQKITEYIAEAFIIDQNI